MKSSVFFIFIIICFSLIARSQTLKKFRETPSEFIDDLETFVSKNVSDKELDNLNEFTKAWKIDSAFSRYEQQRIIDMSNLLLKRNAKSFPHFNQYMQCLLDFKKYDLDTNMYNIWEMGLKEVLDRRKITASKIQLFLYSTCNLIESNILFKSASTTWKADKPDYKFVFDKEFYAEFGEVELTCLAIRDSIKLFKTSGKWIPMESIWLADKGLVTWERGGYSRDEVYAELPGFELLLSKSEYFVENVKFVNKLYFDEPLIGVLHDKVKYNMDTASATYPKFDSYTKNFKIRDLYKDIDYEGGLSMQGSKLVGTGTQVNTAKISVFRHDTLVLLANSNYFGFKKEKISSRRTSIVIRIQQDSIYHPDLVFSFLVSARELNLSKSEYYTSQGPCFNSYHKVDMNFDQLTWKMDESLMRLTATRGAVIGNAYFESVNYFNYNKFIDMQQMDEVHPIISLRSFARKFGSEEFPVEDYADYLKKPLSQVKQLAMRMAFYGFVYYDQNTELITIKPRLHDYLAASVNKIDYDVIGFPSRVNAPLENAIFNISNFDLTINGIPRIYVSDSQNVVIYPRKERIILKRNRSFQFDGTVIAGLLTFHGNNFYFNYDSFNINLQNVDSLDIRYLTGQKDNYGLPVVDRADNKIHHITGDIKIDKSDNKSGRENYPEYPVFNSRENSYVYYERSDIERGVYESDDFFFEVYPFTMDSLDNFNKSSMIFQGEFYSADIFPVFEHKLYLQKDKSLGFRKTTPADGYPVYGGKGIYNNIIHLSNNGLRGNGVLKYLTSEIHSDDFVFYPDSMNTIAREFTVHEQTTGTEFPEVKSTNNDIHWEPYADKLLAYKKDTDFTIFNDSTRLAGHIELTPSGISGKGKMDLKTSVIKSDRFYYKSQGIKADTADFYLRSLIQQEGFTVVTENINLNIDYNQKKGWFKSNEDYTLVNFPENKYISYLNNFIWDMQRSELAMGSKEAEARAGTYTQTFDDEEPEGPRYISVDYKQDSLNFVSPLAYYDYKLNVLKATQVKFIEVADARIYPYEGLVEIKPDAMMKQLNKATIIANKLTKYYTLHTATANILNRNEYNGLANYDYIDENGKKQLIHFEKVGVDTGGQTVANGNIPATSEFTLSPDYRYQGKVYIEAERKYMRFKGATRINHDCGKIGVKWLYFDTIINPEEIYIPVDRQSYDINRSRIFTGCYLHYDSVHIFPTFFDYRKSYSDNPLIEAKGLLYYSKGSHLYKIAEKEKLIDWNLPGNYLSFNNEQCEIYGEGKLSLGEDLGQVELTSIGNYRHDIRKKETTVDMLLGIDFYMPEEIVNILALEIDSLLNLNAVDLNRTTYRKGIQEMVGTDRANALKDELGLFGSYKEIPPELKYTISLNYLKLKWNDETNSYVSEGQIGIGSINNVQINKMMDGYAELRIKRSGDIFDLYLQTDEGDYYYFGYTRGVMHTHSSNRNYIFAIESLKPKLRKAKKVKGKESYIFIVATERKKNSAIMRYRSLINQGKEENDDDFQEF